MVTKCPTRGLDARDTATSMYFLFFFFQAEDGIRDYKVTGVQTCALPICGSGGGLGPGEGGGTGGGAFRAGVNGVGVPICLYCPIPQYSDEARKAKYQGTDRKSGV